MGPSKARDLRLQREEAANWEHIRTQPRPATSDVRVPSVGVLRLQLIVCPPFEEGHAWDVRQTGPGWRLYRSRVVAPQEPVLLLGYNLVSCESERLESYFRRAAAINLPLVPEPPGIFGFDGTTYQLAIFSGFVSDCRFKWWVQPPETWKPLGELAADMLTAFTERPPEE